jgi:hypothetical protein
VLDQVYGGTPPELAKVWEYADPAAPLKSGEIVVIASGAPCIVNPKDAVAVAFALSVAWITNV